MPASQNARTHGFTAETPTLSPEDRLQFEAFRDRLLAEFAPSGAIEEFLFRRLVHAAWNLERMDQAELTLLADLEEALRSDEHDRILARLVRYRASHLRVLQYAKRSLEYEQTQRGLREADNAVRTDAEEFPEPPPHANFSTINHFTNQVTAYEKFGTISPEMRDELSAMDIQARYSNMRMRLMQDLLESLHSRPQSAQDSAQPSSPPPSCPQNTAPNRPAAHKPAA